MEMKKLSQRCHMSWVKTSVAACAGAAALAFATLPASVTAAGDAPGSATATPIKHVIIVVGENRTFDHVFGTYQPKHGETVWNLLSQGIVKADGSPGPNFKKAQQYEAQLIGPAEFSIAPSTSKTPYSTLPAPNTGGTHTAPSDMAPPPFATHDAAAKAEGGALEASDIDKLLTGASTLPMDVVDMHAEVA